MRKLWTVLAALATLSLTNCGYNAIQTTDEQVKAGWSEVVNQYQRRADLVPNLVNSVKGFAQQEKDVLLGVTNARAKVGSIQATPEVLNDPAAFQKFTPAQGELSSALSRLLVVTENYPQLKSDALFKRPDGAARRHREPHHRGAQPLHQGGAGLQCRHPNLPEQPDRDDVRLQGEAELRGREREGDLDRAEGRFQPDAGARQNSCDNDQKIDRDERCKSRLSCAAAVLGLPALAEVAVPPLTGRVVDQTGTLSSGDIASLTQTLKDLEARKGSQIAVLIVPTTDQEPIEQFSLRVAEAWKIGRKKIDDGALLVVAKNDRHLRIEVGYGLEGALTDVTTKRIIDEDITPKFKSGDFAGGVSAGVDRMIRVIDGEKLPAPEPAHWEDAGPLNYIDPCNPFVIFGPSSSAAMLRSTLGRLVGAAGDRRHCRSCGMVCCRIARGRDPRVCLGRPSLCSAARRYRSGGRGRGRGSGWSSAVAAVPGRAAAVQAAAIERRVQRRWRQFRRRRRIGELVA